MLARLGRGGSGVLAAFPVGHKIASTTAAQPYLTATSSAVVPCASIADPAAPDSRRYSGTTGSDGRITMQDRRSGVRPSESRASLSAPASMRALTAVASDWRAAKWRGVRLAPVSGASGSALTLKSWARKRRRVTSGRVRSLGTSSVADCAG